MVQRLIALYRRAYLGLPREVWMLSVAAFVNRFGTMVLPFFTLYLTSERGYQEAAAGRILGIYGVGSIAGAYVGGRLTHRVGAVPLQIGFFLAAVPICLAVPLFRSSWGISLSMFLLSFFAEGVRPAIATAITQFAPAPLQVRAFGLHRMALNLGISFGPALGGVLATISFVWLFVVDAATTFLCAVALWSFFGFRRYSKTKPIHEQQAAESTETASPLADRLCLGFLLLILLSSVVFFQFHATYPLYLRDHYGLSKPMTGAIYAVNTSVIVVFEMLLLDYVQRWPLVPLIGCGTLLSCVGFGMLPFGGSVAYCVTSMLIITLGEMLWMPLASGWIAQRSRRGNRGSYMGVYMMTYSLAGVIAPILGGAIYQFHHDLIWYFSIGLGLLVMTGFAFLQRALTRESDPCGRGTPRERNRPQHI